MIDHVSVAVSDLARSAAFYEAVLAPLGLAKLVTRETTVGFGKAYPEFWINLRDGSVARSADRPACTFACARATKMRCAPFTPRRSRMAAQTPALLVRVRLR